LPAPAFASLFPAGLAVFRQPPSPVTFATGSSSRELCLSFRVLRFVPAPLCSSGAPPLGFSPPLRHQCGESTIAGFPSPLRSVLRVSHPLDGFLLAPPCGFVSPRNHIRDSPFRGFPSAAAVPPRRGPLPSCRLPAPPALLAWGASCADPASGPCSASESVASTEGLARPIPDPLLGFTSSRSSIPDLPPPSRRLRSWSSPRARSRSCSRPTFSVFPPRI